jgi:hypothetical protein
LANRRQQTVADLMAIGVVDRFEPVQIQHANGKGCGALLATASV